MWTVLSTWPTYLTTHIAISCSQCQELRNPCDLGCPYRALFIGAGGPHDAAHGFEIAERGNINAVDVRYRQSDNLTKANHRTADTVKLESIVT